MSLKYFICPDNKETVIEDCLQKCRLGDRHKCLHISVLKQISAGRRGWGGVPSVTQLINGTYQSMLEIIEDYSVLPDEHIFSVFGTATHTLLEQTFNRITHYGFSGLPDFYDEETGELVDFKVSGSYKVAAVLGNIKGKSAGEAAREWTLQMNAYRILLAAEGKLVRDMFIHAIVRDGGTFIAKKRGIETRTVWIPIEHMRDADVLSFFQDKVRKLNVALAQKDWSMCEAHERWDDNLKCKEFCSVRNICKYKKIFCS